MKKTVLTVLVIAAGLALVGAVGWFLYFNSQFASFEDRTHHFSIQYPRQWQMIQQPQPSVAVAFLSPKQTALDTFQENMNVTIQPVPPEMASLSTFSALITRQMTSVFKKSINIAENKDLELNGRRAHRLKFDAPQPDALTSIITWTIKDGNAYIITFVGKTRKYIENQKVIDQALNSFQFK